MKKLIVASNNKGKIAEIKALLGKVYDVRSLSDEGIISTPEESGETFSDNALIKARAVFEMTRCDTLADDSGLIVDSLGGAPGVYSARYAGEHATDRENNSLLLKNLERVKDRAARFVCVVAMCRVDGSEIVAQGSTEGYILGSEQGSSGFGYDPLFFSFDLNKSFGEASAEEKNKVSHRARALRKLTEKLGL